VAESHPGWTVTGLPPTLYGASTEMIPLGEIHLTQVSLITFRVDHAVLALARDRIEQ
jgi:hypothetical protein